MPLTLYCRPLASSRWKVPVALAGNRTPFARVIEEADPRFRFFPIEPGED